MSDLQDLCQTLESVNRDADQLAADLAQRAQHLAQASSRAATVATGTNRADGADAAHALQAASRAAQQASQMLHQVSVVGRGFVSRHAGGGGSRDGADVRDTQGPSSDAGNPRVQTIDDIKGWLGDVNPGYTGDPFDPRSSNCGHCAAVVHSRLSGSGDYVAGESTFSTPQMEAWTGKQQIQMSPGEVEQLLRSKGPGSHAVVGVDRSSGPGHWFNAYFDGKQVVAIDGQTGTIAPWPPDYGDVVLWDAGI